MYIKNYTFTTGCRCVVDIYRDLTDQKWVERGRKKNKESQAQKIRLFISKGCNDFLDIH